MYSCYVKCKQPRPWFELGSPFPVTMTIAVMYVVIFSRIVSFVTSILISASFPLVGAYFLIRNGLALLYCTRLHLNHKIKHFSPSIFLLTSCIYTIYSSQIIVLTFLLKFSLKRLHSANFSHSIAVNAFISPYFLSMHSSLSLFVWVLWHINLCRLFNANPFLYK